MAVGLQRAHAEILGQGEGLLIESFGQLNLWRTTPRRNVAEEVQGIGLAAPFLVRTGASASVCSARVWASSRRPARTCASQSETTERLQSSHVRRHRLFPRLREQHGVGHASGQGVRRTQGRRNSGKIARDVRLLTAIYGPFKPGERSGQVALAEGQQPPPVANMRLLG